jgi:hypothetical protein
MRRLVRVVLGISVVMAIAQGALGQTTDVARAATLHRSLELTIDSMRFFSQVSGWIPAPSLMERRRKPLPAQEEVERHCDQLRDAVDAFVRAAPATAIQEAQERARMLALRRGGQAPESLQVPIGCERQAGHEWLDHMATFAMTLFSLVHGASERQEVDTKLGPIAEDRAFYGSVSPPGNGLELFGNLKWLVRNGALLRRDLYTERSMRQVLGIEPFVTRNAYGGLGFDFRRLTSSESLAKASRGSDVCTYQAALGPRADNAELDFECTYLRHDMPTFEQVEALFGSSWKGPSPRLSGTAVALHGNELMYYNELSDRAERNLLIRLWPNATLRSFSLVERRPE